LNEATSSTLVFGLTREAPKAAETIFTKFNGLDLKYKKEVNRNSEIFDKLIKADIRDLRNSKLQTCESMSSML